MLGTVLNGLQAVTDPQHTNVHEMHSVPLGILRCQVAEVSPALHFAMHPDTP